MNEQLSHKPCPLCGKVMMKITIKVDNNEIPVVIRGACPDDKEKLISFYEKLTMETIYTRFFSIVRYFDPYVERILKSPAYVIVAERTDTQEIIGVAEAIPGEDASKAEAGIVILESFQGHGLGSQMAKALNKVLYTNGIRYVYGYILPENIKAYRLVKKLGGRIKSYYESMLLVEIPIREPSN